MYNAEIKHIISNIVENMEIEDPYIEDGKLCCKKIKFKNKFCNYYKALKTLNIYKADYVDLTFLDYIEDLEWLPEVVGTLDFMFFIGQIKSYKTSMKKCDRIYCMFSFIRENGVFFDMGDIFFNDDIFPEVKENGTVIRTIDKVTVYP